MLYQMVTGSRRQSTRSLGGVVLDAIRTVFQLALILLMILGIGGIFYQAMSPGGVVPQVFSSAWNRGPMYLFFVSMGIFTGGVWLRNFMYRRPAVSSFTGDAMAAAFIAAGVYSACR